MRRFIVVAAVGVVLLSLSGCMLEGANGTSTSTLEGTVSGVPITGTYQAVPTASSGSLPGCLSIDYDVTLTDGAGDTVTKQESLFGCSGDPLNVSFIGTYSVTGGTGTYAGATGSGTTTLTWNILPGCCIRWTSQEFGSFEVPGTASAASTRRRTFKSHGTVSAVKLQGRWAKL